MLAKFQADLRYFATAESNKKIKKRLKPLLSGLGTFMMFIGSSAKNRFQRSGTTSLLLHLRAQLVHSPELA